MVVRDMPLTTVVSDPERGPGGDPKYRGNWGGNFVGRLLDYFEPRRVLDPMAGSGTTLDVCELRGIEADGYDLNPNPRRGIGGWDATTDDFDRSGDAIFFHPPYWDAIKYSGAMWGDEPDPRDLSQIKAWGDFVHQMNALVLKFWGALRVGGHMVVLVGDIARKGRLYSMQHEIAWPGTAIREIVKLQHNALSYQTPYGGRFIPIVHEYALVFRKDEPYLCRVVYTVSTVVDLRTREQVSWLDAVQAAVEALGGEVEVQQVYAEIERSFQQRIGQNQFWREKVRQCLQNTKRFQRTARGRYALA